MSSLDPYAEYYATPEEWRALQEEERERVEFYSLPPHEALAILRAAFPVDGVIMSLDKPFSGIYPTSTHNSGTKNSLNFVYSNDMIQVRGIYKSFIKSDLGDF
jgi:hypothetical protein